MPTTTATKQVTFSQQALASAIATVMPAVPSRPSHPVLANILVQVESGSISLSAFDLSIGIKTELPIEADFSERFCLPAKLTSDIVGKLTGDLTIKLEEEGVVIKSSSGKYKLPKPSADEFPAFPETVSASIEVPASVLLEGFQATRFSASSDETKQVLTGVHLTGRDLTNLEFASTDGHRLSTTSLDNGSVTVQDLEVTIPAKAIDALNKILPKAEKLLVWVQDGVCKIDAFGTVLTTRLIEGQYPNYRQLIPNQFSVKASADRKALLSALERISVFAEQKNNIVVLKFGNQGLVVECEAADVGSGREEVACDCDGDLDIAFNVDYLIQGLKAMRSELVKVCMNGPKSPAVIKDSERMEYLVMPVQQRS